MAHTKHDHDDIFSSTGTPGGAAKGATDDVLLPLLAPPALLPQPLLALRGRGRRRLSVSRRVPRGLPDAAPRALALALPPQPPLRGRLVVAYSFPLAHPSYPTVAGAPLRLPPTSFCKIETPLAVGLESKIFEVCDDVVLRQYFRERTKLP
jgi:hypothetical protein